MYCNDCLIQQQTVNFTRSVRKSTTQNRKGSNCQQDSENGKVDVQINIPIELTIEDRTVPILTIL